MTKSKESLSLDNEIELHGVIIKKMPNGQYLKALETIKEMPENFVKELMEGRTDLKLSDMFDTQNIAMLMGTLLTSVPEFTIKFIAKLLNISEKTLKDDVTPLETIEIVEKFWEINNLTSFFQKMKPIMSKAVTLIGFKEQLPSALKSESVNENF